MLVNISLTFYFQQSYINENDADILISDLKHRCSQLHLNSKLVASASSTTSAEASLKNVHGAGQKQS